MTELEPYSKSFENSDRHASPDQLNQKLYIESEIQYCLKTLQSYKAQPCLKFWTW